LLIPLGILAASGAAAAGAYELIATTTLSSTAQTITFSSIPQDFKHLQLRVVARTSESSFGGSPQLWINGNTTTTNYYRHALAGNGSTVFSEAQSQNSEFGLISGASAPTDVFGAAIIDISDYTNTSKTRTIRTMSGVHTNNSNANQVRLTSNLFNNTSAVTSLVFDLASTATYSIGSRFSLYGIRG